MKKGITVHNPAAPRPYTLFKIIRGIDKPDAGSVTVGEAIIGIE